MLRLILLVILCSQVQSTLSLSLEAAWKGNEHVPSIAIKQLQNMGSNPPGTNRLQPLCPPTLVICRSGSPRTSQVRAPCNGSGPQSAKAACVRRLWIPLKPDSPQAHCSPAKRLEKRKIHDVGRAIIAAGLFMNVRDDRRGLSSGPYQKRFGMICERIQILSGLLGPGCGPAARISDDNALPGTASTAAHPCLEKR